MRDYTINELVKDKEAVSVYILNTSDETQSVNGQPIKAAINFSLKMTTGETALIKIPNTWIPLDLSMQAAKEDIQRSHTFRSLINKRAIKLISEEEALNILKTDRAVKEMKRLNKNESTNLTIENYRGEQTEQEKTNLTPAEGLMQGVDINLTVVDMFGRDDIDDEERETTLVALACRLTEEDWKYVMNITQSDSIKALAVEELEKKK